MIASAKVKGLSTVSQVRVLETSKWITTITYYDDKGRPWEVYTDNEHLGTKDWVLTKLDFIGKIEKTFTKHLKNGVMLCTLDTYTYDHMGRQLVHTQQIDDHPKEMISSNIYDELGQLTRKKVGNTIKAPLQIVDYRYNVRGWLTDINDVNAIGNDLFTFKINYDTPQHGATALYNGNISETKWKTANDNALRWYKYNYDVLNRILTAHDNNGDYLLEGISYDKNGNIHSLYRTGYNPTTGNYDLTDFLDYTYDNGNKLLKVSDRSQNDEGFKDGNTTGNDYEYDANGNLTKDRNKGVMNITYNHLNLPDNITIANNTTSGTINYIYDATGVKLKKTVSGGGSLTTEYAGNYVYKNGVFTFFNHPEGYVEPNGNGGFDYIYQYLDHLGNIRLSYSDKDGDGKVDIVSCKKGQVCDDKGSEDIDGDGDYAMEILEEKNYYPFGLEHKGYNNTVSGVPHNYSYNAKEFEQSLDLNTFDLGARQYDPAIGRFMVIDPMADFINNQSPYMFAYNNPIQFIDEYGLGGCTECSFFGKIFRAIGSIFRKDDPSKENNSIAAGNTKRNQSRATGRKKPKRKKQKGTTPPPPNPDPSGAVQKDAFAVAKFDIQSLVLEQSQLPEIVEIPDPRPTTPNITLPGGVPRVIAAGSNISVPTHIQFTGDGTDLAIDAMTKRTLNAIIKTLTDYPQIKLEVYVNYTGVNSLRSDPNFEQRVSSQTNKRGRKIVEFLIRRGVNPNRVRARQGETIFEKRKQNNTRRNTQNFKIINN
ncbi:hypothetical protein AB832_03385 [Flavobacteriaceae bacterium (ex Bugula neritina AB1)]|nr:hypothetical protein AB832_03385 [Flavobacteriaceae bacterium (ex Bugula neritina AB1)]